MKEVDARMDLFLHSLDLKCTIEKMTEVWKYSGLSWNTDIMSKFYVMSSLAKDVIEYIDKETDKDYEDKPNEEELHKIRIDCIVEALIRGVDACDGIADVDIYKKAHDDVTDEEIEEALEILDHDYYYNVHRPGFTLMCRNEVVKENVYTLVTRNDINFDDAVNYILKRRGLKIEE